MRPYKNFVPKERDKTRRATFITIIPMLRNPCGISERAGRRFQPTEPNWTTFGDDGDKTDDLVELRTHLFSALLTL